LTTDGASATAAAAIVTVRPAALILVGGNLDLDLKTRCRYRFIRDAPDDAEARVRVSRAEQVVCIAAGEVSGSVLRPIAIHVPA
jgi:hypothetical protein